MTRYIVLLNFTEKGISNVAQSAGRAEAFEKLAKQAGASVTANYWTVGKYDGVFVIEAPDEKIVSALLMKLGAQGNVRTQSLRAFNRSELEEIVAKVK